MELSDPRRNFPRISLVGIHELRELTGARVEWENAQRTEVLDMSYSGIAVVRPSGIEFEKGKNLSVKLMLSGFPVQSVGISLVRETEKIFGVKFLELSKSNIDSMDQFLSDKFLGRNLKAVNPQFFSSNHDFNHWLHGPNNTNLYIWEKDGKFSRAVFEFAGLAMYCDGKIELKNIKQERDDDDFLVFPMSRHMDLAKVEDFVSRSLKVLSQIEEPPAAVFTLIDILKERPRKA